MLYLSKSKVREKIDKRVMPNVNEVDGDLEISQRGMDRLEDIADDGGFTLNELVENFKAKFFGDKEAEHATDINDEAFRFREFEAFKGVRPDIQERKEFDINPMNLSDYDEWVPNYFKRIVRVEQLKETRVFTGFSRITPSVPGPKLNAEIYQHARNWLPAIEVRGEGMVYEFADGDGVIEFLQVAIAAYAMRLFSSL